MGKDVAEETMTDEEMSWSVTVDVDGTNILTISTVSLSGKSTFTDAEEEAIRTAGEHLTDTIIQKS